MRPTNRDVKLVRDLALSQVLSRDQVLALGYFGSITRVNTRLRELVDAEYADVLTTPFHGQRLYRPGLRAREVVGERIACLLATHPPTPRFLQHALGVTNARIALSMQGLQGWRFEGQLRHSFTWAGRSWESRPDGALREDGVLTFLELDLGHVAPMKFARKLKSYDALVDSGEFKRVWQESGLSVLTITTGGLRRARLATLAPSGSHVCFRFSTLDCLGITLPGGWS